jgi:transposase
VADATGKHQLRHQSAQLKDIRRADPDGQGRHSFTAQQQTLRRLSVVFAAYFDRVKAAAKPGEKKPAYPRFKPYRKVRNRRRHFHHKTARALINQCDVIALEDLHTAGMTRRPLPRPDLGKAGTFLPNRTAAKAGLNKSILDAGWAQFTTILVGKAAEAGRRVVLVNPAGTSVSCHRCGSRCARPQQKVVICPMHGVIDADVNGARNIASRAGLGSGQATPAA